LVPIIIRFPSVFVPYSLHFCFRKYPFSYLFPVFSYSFLLPHKNMKTNVAPLSSVRFRSVFIPTLVASDRAHEFDILLASYVFPKPITGILANAAATKRRTRRTRRDRTIRLGWEDGPVLTHRNLTSLFLSPRTCHIQRVLASAHLRRPTCFRHPCISPDELEHRRFPCSAEGMNASLSG
jgi:hypothetical protein